ncbi:MULTISPECIES: streptophobe family protein [Streptomyces]|uniref:streptophobe family protein n=1 Tax=Streptomyces TaxID=1883 RepID=UPI0018849159|nr:MULTISPECIES: streptophobe family protein [Streptomyces]MCX5038662.1 streptophobe family protein [Streptomyces coelicoflavus]
MGASTSVGTEGHGARVPWGDVLLSALASVSWALIGMAGTAALGLRLLDADAAGSLGPMTAAVVALGAGGSVSPAGDVSAFGLEGARAHAAVEITPLGVSLVGALFLSFFFLRSLRAAGVVVARAELLARAGSVIALFVAMTGGLAWAGHDLITIDGASLGLDDLGGGGGDGGLEIPGLGEVGDIGGLLPDRVGDLAGARVAVGFGVDTAPTLLGGLVWSAGVLLVAMLASRRTPLPRGWGAVHRVVRPAVSALVTVALTAVAAGCAAAAWAATGDDHPRRIAGAALLGAPNGAWLGVPTGLFVPWDGRATGALTGVLPAPLDDLLGSGTEEPVTLGRLAELDGRVWLLGVAAALLMLLTGVLTAVRTPVGPGDARPLVFAGRCALRLGIATAVTLPLSARLTEVSVSASLSVLGIDAFGAGIDLHGHLGVALLLGAVWGAGAGAAGALAACASGAAGARATGLARGAGAVTEGIGAGSGAATEGIGTGGGASAGPASGPYLPGAPHRAPDPGVHPCRRSWKAWEGVARPESGTAPGTGEPEDARPAGAPPPPRGAWPLPGPGHTASGAQPPGSTGQGHGHGQAEQADPAWQGGGGGRPSGAPGQYGDGAGREDGGTDRRSDDDVYDAPTVAGPPGPPPGTPRRPPRPGERPPRPRPRARPWGEGPPPPPPPPPAPPRRPRDG